MQQHAVEEHDPVRASLVWGEDFAVGKFGKEALEKARGQDRARAEMEQARAKMTRAERGGHEQDITAAIADYMQAYLGTRSPSTP